MKPVLLVLAVIMVMCSFPITAFASNGGVEVLGKVYEFDKDSNYEFDGIVIWQNPDGSVYQVSPHSKANKIANSLVEYIIN